MLEEKIKIKLIYWLSSDKKKSRFLHVPWPTTDIEKDFLLNKILSGPDHIISGLDQMISGPDHITSGPDHITSGLDHILSGPDRTGCYVLWTGYYLVRTGKYVVWTRYYVVQTRYMWSGLDKNLFRKKIFFDVGCGPRYACQRK